MSLVEIKTIKKKFVDIDLSFAKHPISNDVSKKVNESAIIASIKNLVLTKMYGRPFHPELSSQVHSLLFEQLTHSTAETLQQTIKYVIDNFEPRVQVLLITVAPGSSESEISVFLVFRMIGSIDTIKTQFTLQRAL